jgi:hypothetical protein
MAKFDMRDYARRGAEARLAELAEEARSILAAFPEFYRGDMPFEKPATRGASRGLSRQEALTAPVKRRKRPKMSAAQRKAVGERMKRYWAARKANGKK